MEISNIQQHMNQMLEDIRIENEMKRKADRRGPPSFKSIRNDYYNLKRSYEENRIWKKK